MEDNTKAPKIRLNDFPELWTFYNNLNKNIH